jgi:hypothetical protein
MRSNTFVTRLTRGAVASSLAVSWLVPEKHSATVAPPVVAREAVVTDQATMPSEAGHAESAGLVVVNLRETPKEWTPGMEREFRRLALDEAKGTLTADARTRLEELNLLRNRLYNPRSAEEVLLQLRRDRLLEKMSDVLRQYVEFQEGARRARSATA